jgi:hypothetical protein
MANPRALSKLPSHSSTTSRDYEYEYRFAEYEYEFGTALSLLLRVASRIPPRYENTLKGYYQRLVASEPVKRFQRFFVFLGLPSQGALADSRPWAVLCHAFGVAKQGKTHLLGHKFLASALTKKESRYHHTPNPHGLRYSFVSIPVASASL